MFEAGKRYWAENGDRRAKVLCVARTRSRATFLADDNDAARRFGTNPRFTRKITVLDMSGADGRVRECIASVSEKRPGCDWCITDKLVVGRSSADGKETQHVGAGEVGLELLGGEAVGSRRGGRLWRKANGLR